MGFKTEVLKRPHLVVKPLLATAIIAESPHANGDSACAEQNTYPEMGNRIWGKIFMRQRSRDISHTLWK